MIRSHRLDTAGGPHRAQPVEELVDVLDFLREPPAGLPRLVIPVDAVFLEHRPAAGVVDDDGIDLFQVEGRDVGVGQATGTGSRGPIPPDRNPCLAERAAEPGWTLPLPAVPREGTARLHAAE